LLELAGFGVPAEFTGGSFADAFQRDRHPEDEKVFFEHYCAHWGLHPFYGVRTRDMKYIRYYGDDDGEEMYDLGKDSHELYNVASDPAFAESKKYLSEMADNWWRETGGKTVDYYESEYFKANRHNLKKD
jgi:arylsulfatase A-like enzyme